MITIYKDMSVRIVHRNHVSYRNGGKTFNSRDNLI